MNQVFLGLGTNIGNRQHNLEMAIAKLSEIVAVTAVSPVYETEPWGPIAQPDFLNACLAVTTDLKPQTLLTSIKILEQELGRSLTQKWGPRLIDIDILLYEDVVYQTDQLTIPHPFMHERAFVLFPLADIAADVVHPVLGQTIAKMVTAVKGQVSTIKRLPDQIPLLQKVTI